MDESLLSRRFELAGISLNDEQETKIKKIMKDIMVAGCLGDPIEWFINVLRDPPDLTLLRKASLRMKENKNG